MVSDRQPVGGAGNGAVLGGRRFACVPIENSIEGSVLPTLDSLATGSPLQIFAEYTLDIAFTIATRTGVTEPVSIAAFPVARAQVARWVAKNLPRPSSRRRISNAAAAVDVADGRADAAVTTPLAAQRHGLEVLAAGVVDEPNARTRFVLAGRSVRRRGEPTPIARRLCCDWTTCRGRWPRRWGSSRFATST